MQDCKITILTVSWYSAGLLHDLINNLIEKASRPEHLKYLIIDNSDGKDQALKNLKFPSISVKICPHDPGKFKNLYAHAAGLNYGFSKIDTDLILIVDPDIHIFKENWDTFLIEQMNQKELDLIGTAYPPWWLGTYHNFPSPIFSLAKTASLKKINADWIPEKCNLLIRLRNVFLRQILRACFLFNRRNLTKYPCLRTFTQNLEKILPVCSIDTGYKLSREAKRGKLKSATFKAMYKEELGTLTNQKSTITEELAKQFELYCYESEIILTHQYGSQNFLLKTEKGKDKKYWQGLIEKFIHLRTKQKIIGKCKTTRNLNC